MWSLKNLNAKRCGGWGVFIALNHLVAVGQGCWRWADRHYSLSGALPRHPTVRVRSWVDRWSFVFLRHRTVRCLLTLLLWLLRGTVHFHYSLYSRPLRAESCCSAGSLDSSVAHRTVRWIIAERALEFPRVAGWHLYSPGAPDTVWWHTGQSGAPFFSTLKSFCSNKIVTLTWYYPWFVLNLMHL
jgi:hypothetical protein